ncbi:hypothetical protein SLS60_003792 [Paraconiothyrium brasiliense]|uniref:Uncharacterized protein n=1 Tax=Paraconiothyrium brasiliense TaxID=300254 RepID=A0ABR3RQJ3_9PLEO
MPASSIQSYFSSSSPTKSCPGDGFTSEELQAPSPTPEWMPVLDYEESDIASLEAGPRYLTIMGRIVNVYHTPKPSKQPKSAQGFFKLMVADDTGVMTVRLWYAKSLYALKLGQLVTLWTVHISQGDGQVGLAPNAAPIFTSIFPENERNCHFMIHERSDDGTLCRRPFGAKDNQVLPGLMTLRNFTDGGFDVDDFTNKNGNTSESVYVVVLDDTSEGFLTLYGSVSGSASAWIPYQTALLIANPGWRIDRSAKLSLNANTQLYIDPALAEARYLRALTQRLIKREHVNPNFPHDVFDAKEAEGAAIKILYKLSDIDEFVRTNPKEKAVGYMSIILTQLNIVVNYKREMLMSNECCGKPIFASKVVARCRQCDRECTLRINPRILGDVIDETGTISTGKLIFSDAAWEQLLGRTAEQLVSASLEVMKYLEQRLLFLRLTLGFGIHLGNEEIGRLVVWCVKM